MSQPESPATDASPQKASKSTQLPPNDSRSSYVPPERQRTFRAEPTSFGVTRDRLEYRLRAKSLVADSKDRRPVLQPSSWARGTPYGTGEHHVSAKASFAPPLGEPPASQSVPSISFSMPKFESRKPLSDVSQKLQGKMVVDAKSTVSVPHGHFEQIPEYALSETPGETIDLTNEQSDEETPSVTNKPSKKSRSQKRSERRRKRRERLAREWLETLSLRAPSQTMNNDKPTVLSKRSKPSSRQRRSRRKRLEKLGQTSNEDIEMETSKDTPLQTPTDPFATALGALGQSKVGVELQTEGQTMTLTGQRKLKKQLNIDNLDPEHNEMIARLRENPEDPEAKKCYQDVLGYKNSTYHSGQGALTLNEDGKRTAQQIEEHEQNMNETKRRKLEKIEQINEGFEERLGSLNKKVAEIGDMLADWKARSLAFTTTESKAADATMERNIAPGGKLAGRGILAVI